MRKEYFSSYVFDKEAEKILAKKPELKAELHLSPEAVTYMWSDQVEHDKSVKSLGVLWENSN